MAAAVISRNRSSEVSLIMTRASSGSSLFDDSRMDKTLLLNLELKRNERRRNLRYRNSATWDSENVKQNQVCPDLSMIFNLFCWYDLKFPNFWKSFAFTYIYFLGCLASYRQCITFQENQAERMSMLQGFWMSFAWNPKLRHWNNCLGRL